MMWLLYIGLGLAALALVQAWLARRDRLRFFPDADFVNGLHACRMGTGSPVIVFESGLAASCFSWNKVQSKLSHPSLSYNRAEIGSHGKGSDPLEAMVQDLHALTQALKISSPHILVAHSFGGYIARLYAWHFPAQLAGVLLVDPLTPEEWLRPSLNQRWRLRRAIFFTQAAGVLACFGLVRFGVWMILSRKKEGPAPISRYVEVMRRIRSEVKKLPPEVIQPVRANWSRPAFFRNMAAYLKMLPASAGTVAETSFPAGVPVTVLSSGSQPEAVLAAHRAVATRHIGASQAGHFIHLDEPELVVRELQALVIAAGIDCVAGVPGADEKTLQ
jgi:pimeloyl-ACP methyl ester carboxylesterase